MSPDAANFDGETALHTACEHGSTKIVELLLDVQASPVVEAANGKNALMCACDAEQMKIIEMILDRDESEDMSMILASGHPQSLHAFGGEPCGKCWDYSGNC